MVIHSKRHATGSGYYRMHNRSEPWFGNGATEQSVIPLVEAGQGQAEVRLGLGRTVLHGEIDIGNPDSRKIIFRLYAVTTGDVTWHVLIGKSNREKPMHTD